MVVIVNGKGDESLKRCIQNKLIDTDYEIVTDIGGIFYNVDGYFFHDIRDETKKPLTLSQLEKVGFWGAASIDQSM
ncbi:MAG: hypothetical protein AABX30_00750 [Nanoarchaeota archaeon]